MMLTSGKTAVQLELGGMSEKDARAKNAMELVRLRAICHGVCQSAFLYRAGYYFGNIAATPKPRRSPNRDDTYRTGRTPLRHPRFPQLVSCRLGVLRCLFAPLFILAQICDGGVGFPSREN